jgi:hypothetical protein
LRKKFVLCVQEFKERATFDNIAAHFESMLHDWRISRDRFHIVLRDQGTNMVKVCLKGAVRVEKKLQLIAYIHL